MQNAALKKGSSYGLLGAVSSKRPQQRIDVNSENPTRRCVSTGDWRTAPVLYGKVPARLRTVGRSRIKQGFQFERFVWVMDVDKAATAY